MNFGEDLGLQLLLANKAYHQYLFEFLKEIDIYQNYQVILMINRAGGQCTQKAICENLQIEKSNMVGIISQLEDRGYVVKTVNYKDRRGKLIALTLKANEAIKILQTLFAVFEDHLSNEITWQEMHNCIWVLTKINNSLASLSLKQSQLSELKGQITQLEKFSIDMF